AACERDAQRCAFPAATEIDDARSRSAELAQCAGQGGEACGGLAWLDDLARIGRRTSGEERIRVRCIPAGARIARAPGSQGTSRDGGCFVPGVAAPGPWIRSCARRPLRSLSASL